MLEKTEITICLGSSCFARGNKHLVQVVKNYLAEHQLTHKVNFKGKHCFGNCESGPAMEINQRRYENISSETIIEILDKALIDKT
jgi:NADH:ubiquinone oxidoreductase subunit E